LPSTPHKATSRIKERSNKTRSVLRLWGSGLKLGVLLEKDDKTTNAKIRPRTYAEILKSGKKY